MESDRMRGSRPVLAASPRAATTRFVALGVLVAYAALLVRWMVFKDVPTITLGTVRLNFSGTDGDHPPNLVPLRTILPYLLGSNGLLIGAVNLAGNIVVLVPIGLLLPFAGTRITWRGALILAGASGLGIEAMQTILHVGVFDIDDVILNALGLMVGYVASQKSREWMRTRSYRPLALSGCLLVATAAAFYAFMIYPLSHATLTADAGTRAQGGANRARAGVDPCNGTGGNGAVVTLGSDSLTLEPRNGAQQVVALTQRTVFRNSTGPVARSDLRVGDRVTLVIDTGETASLVLVCGVAHH